MATPPTVMVSADGSSSGISWPSGLAAGCFFSAAGPVSCRRCGRRGFVVGRRGVNLAVGEACEAEREQEPGFHESVEIGLETVDAGGHGDAALAEFHAEGVFLLGVDVELVEFLRDLDADEFVADPVSTRTLTSWPRSVVHWSFSSIWPSMTYSLPRRLLPLSSNSLDAELGDVAEGGGFFPDEGLAGDDRDDDGGDGTDDDSGMETGASATGHGVWVYAEELRCEKVGQSSGWNASDKVARDQEKSSGKPRFRDFSVSAFPEFQNLPPQSHCGLRTPAQAAMSATPMCAPRA